MDRNVTQAVGNSFDPIWISIADRPDPSRAEMAMHIYPTVLAGMESAVERGEAGFTPGWREHAASEAVKLADALIAALARKEKQ